MYKLETNFEVGDTVKVINNKYSWYGKIGVISSILSDPKYDSVGVKFPDGGVGIYLPSDIELVTEADLQVGDKAKVIYKCYCHFDQVGTVTRSVGDMCWLTFPDGLTYSFDKREIEKIDTADFNIGDKVQINAPHLPKNRHGRIGYITERYTNSNTYQWYVKINGEEIAFKESELLFLEHEEQPEIKDAKFKKGDLVKVISSNAIHKDKIGTIKGSYQGDLTGRIFYDITFEDGDCYLYEDTLMLYVNPIEASARLADGIWRISNNGCTMHHIGPHPSPPRIEVEEYRDAICDIIYNSRSKGMSSNDITDKILDAISKGNS